MIELKIYLDKEKKHQIEDEIIFDTVLAGEITNKSIFIENIIGYPININLSLVGEDVSIVKDIEDILPGSLEEVEFGFTPQLTAMAPITAKLDIKLNYVVR